MGRRLLLACGLAVVVGCSGPVSEPAPSLGGRVLDDAGGGLAGAEICWIAEGELEGCVASDADGSFALPTPARERLRVAADGYHVRQLGRVALDAPIVLTRSPVLFVRLFDAVSREPIDEGQVRVTLPTGREFGPFPVGRAGLRVRRVLPPGDALVRASAPGYGPVDPVAIRLEPGRETSVEIPLAAGG